MDARMATGNFVNFTAPSPGPGYAGHGWRGQSDGNRKLRQLYRVVARPADAGADDVDDPMATVNFVNFTAPLGPADTGHGWRGRSDGNHNLRQLCAAGARRS